MDFDYADYFEESNTASGYETLIMIGWCTLFKRADNIEDCWEFFSNLFWMSGSPYHPVTFPIILR